MEYVIILTRDYTHPIGELPNENAQAVIDFALQRGWIPEDGNPISVKDDEGLLLT